MIDISEKPVYRFKKRDRDLSIYNKWTMTYLGVTVEIMPGVMNMCDHERVKNMIIENTLKGVYRGLLDG